MYGRHGGSRPKAERLLQQVDAKRLRLYQLRSSGEWLSAEAKALRREVETLSRALNALDPTARFRSRLFRSRAYAQAMGGGVSWRRAAKLYGATAVPKSPKARQP